MVHTHSHLSPYAFLFLLLNQPPSIQLMLLIMCYWSDTITPSGLSSKSAGCRQSATLNLTVLVILIHDRDENIKAAGCAWRKFCTDCTNETLSMAANQYICTLKWHLSPPPPFTELWKTCNSVPAWFGRGLLSRCLISFLVSCPNKEPQEETVFTELSAAPSEPCEVSRLRRHMFGIFRFYLDRTFQVNVKRTQVLTDLNKNAHI